jgi:thiosulfate dehydrogenase
LKWRDLDWIPVAERIPIDKLDPREGRKLYAQNCAACHGLTGKGDGWAPGLWGENSYNDGSGLGRIYTLAGFLFRAMPLSSPNSLNLEQAQQIAAYLDAEPRPAFTGKAQDYSQGHVPVDAVYYPQLYPKNPLTEKLNGHPMLP